MGNLKILSILMRYITATVFSVTYRFVITQDRKTFTCQSMKQDASLTLGKALEKTEKRAKDGVLLTALHAKKNTALKKYISPYKKFEKLRRP